MIIFTKLCVVVSEKMLKTLNNLFKQQFLIILLMFYEKSAPWDIHTEVLIGQSYDRHNLE